MTINPNPKIAGTSGFWLYKTIAIKVTKTISTPDHIA